MIGYKKYLNLMSCQIQTYNLLPPTSQDTPDSTTTDGREPDKFTSPPAPPPPINMPKPFNNGVSHSPVRTSKHSEPAF